MWGGVNRTLQFRELRYGAILSEQKALSKTTKIATARKPDSCGFTDQRRRARIHRTEARRRPAAPAGARTRGRPPRPAAPRRLPPAGSPARPCPRAGCARRRRAARVRREGSAARSSHRAKARRDQRHISGRHSHAMSERAL